MSRDSISFAKFCTQIDTIQTIGVFLFTPVFFLTLHLTFLLKNNDEMTTKSGSKNQSRAALKLVFQVGRHSLRFFVQKCRKSMKELIYHFELELASSIDVNKTRRSCWFYCWMLFVRFSHLDYVNHDSFFAKWLTITSFCPFIFLLTPYPEAYFPATEIGGSAWKHCTWRHVLNRSRRMPAPTVRQDWGLRGTFEDGTLLAMNEVRGPL